MKKNINNMKVKNLRKNIINMKNMNMNINIRIISLRVKPRKSLLNCINKMKNPKNNRNLCRKRRKKNFDIGVSNSL